MHCTPFVFECSNKMEHLVTSISSSDPKEKLIGAEALLGRLKAKPKLPDLPTDVRLQHFDCIILLIKDVNPKLSMIGLDCLQIVTESGAETFRCMANMSFVAAVSKLMDTKQNIRDRASDAILSLVKFVGLQMGLDRLISLAISKNVNARESFVKIVKVLFASYGEEVIAYPQIVSKLSQLLHDSHVPIKQSAIEIFTQFYTVLGASLISELESLAVKPSHLKSLTDAIRASGQSFGKTFTVATAPISKLSAPGKINSSVKSSRSTNPLNSSLNILQREKSEDKVIENDFGKSGAILSSHEVNSGTSSPWGLRDNNNSFKEHIVSALKSGGGVKVEDEHSKKVELSLFSHDYIMSLIAEKQIYLQDGRISSINDANGIHIYFLKIQKSLQDKDDWQVRVSALTALQSLLLFNRNCHAEPILRSKLIACLNQHKDLIGSQLADLRSAISKEACRTVAIAAIQLSANATSFLEYMLPILLKQIALKVQVMSQAADKTVRIIISSSTSGYTRFFLTTLYDNSLGKVPSIRQYCIEFLMLTVATWRPEVTERSLEIYKSAIKSRINDNDQITRKKVRQLYILLGGHPGFSQSMKTFMESEIDHSYQKLIFTDMLSPADDLLEVQALFSSCLKLTSHFTKPLLDKFIQTMVVDLKVNVVANVFPNASMPMETNASKGLLTEEKENDSQIDNTDVSEGQIESSNRAELEVNEGGGIKEVYGEFAETDVPVTFLNKDTPNVDLALAAHPSYICSDEFKAMAGDPLWSTRVACLETIQERLLLQRSPLFSKVGGEEGGNDNGVQSFPQEREAADTKDGFYLDLFVDLSVDLISDAHHKVVAEALRAVRLIILHFQSHMQSRLTLLMTLLFQRVVDRHSNIKDNAGDLLETLRITYEPKVIIAALYSTLVDAPDRLKVFVIQYLNVIVPHCDYYFNQPQQAWFFLSRLGVILGDSNGSMASNSLLEAGKRLLELIYRATPTMVCIQLANLPIQQQITLKNLLVSCVPNIDALVAKAAKQDWNLPIPNTTSSSSHNLNPNPNPIPNPPTSQFRQLSRHSVLSYSKGNNNTEIAGSKTTASNPTYSTNDNINILVSDRDNSPVTEEFDSSNPRSYRQTQRTATVPGKDQKAVACAVESNFNALVEISTSTRGGKNLAINSSPSSVPSPAALGETKSGGSNNSQGDILWLLSALKVTSSSTVKQEALLELKRIAKQERYDFWHMNFPQIVCVLLEALQPDLLSSQIQSANSVSGQPIRETSDVDTVKSSNKMFAQSIYEIASPVSATESGGHFFMHLNVVIKALMILIKHQPHFVQVFLDLLVTRMIQAASYLPADLTLMCERLLLELLPTDPLRITNLIIPFTTPSVRPVSISDHPSSSNPSSIISSFGQLPGNTKNNQGVGECTGVAQSPPLGKNKEDSGYESRPTSTPLVFDCGDDAALHRDTANIQILSLRLLAAAIRRLTSPLLLSRMDALVVCIVPSLSHSIADIRKSALFVLIEAYFLVGDVLYPYLNDMTLAQRKLLTVYIDKLRQERDAVGKNR